MTTPFRRVHHVGLSVGGAAEDREFHENVLGLRLADRRQERYHGQPVTRQVYETGGDEPMTFLSCLCLDDGEPGRRGSGGAKTINLSVGAYALGFWQQRLHEAHIDSSLATVLDSERLSFIHPSGIEYSLVGVGSDGRRGSERPDIPKEHAIRGLHSVTISLLDVREMTDFLTDLAGAEHVVQDQGLGLFLLDAASPASRVELLHEPYRAPGTWRYAPGTVHHVAFDVGTPADRGRLREQMADRGYADISAEVVEAGFSSVWLRAPGGLLLDLVCRSGP